MSEARKTLFNQCMLLDTIHERDVNPETREIFLHGHIENESEYDPGVDYRMAVCFHKNLRYLESLSSDPVLIHMHTPGGFWEDGMGIYDSIKASECFIAIVSYAHARSMSSIILQAADQRIMMPNSIFMFHMGIDEIIDTALGVLTEAEQLKLGCQKMFDIYVNKCRNGSKFVEMSDKKIQNHLERCMERKQDVYLIAQEAVDWGFADDILGSDTCPTLKQLRDR